jgi:protein-disulfide isomerase
MTDRSTKSGQGGGTRRDRRDAARRDARLRSAATTQTQQPFWKSTMFLLTIGAIAVAAVLVGVVFFSSRGSGGPSSTIQEPLVFTPTASADGLALGSATAPVTMQVWSDFQCPACDAFAKGTEVDIIDKYVTTGQVRLVYEDVWFIGASQGNTESLDSAAAARCSAEQGKFWPYHDYLFSNQGKENGGWVTRELIDGIAQRVGLDMGAFKACYEAGEAHQQVKDNTALSQKVPISGTPTIVLNGTPYQSQYIPTAAQLSVEIDRLLAAASPAPSGSTAPSASPNP